MKKENKTILILLVLVIVAIIAFLFLNSKEKEKIEQGGSTQTTYKYGREPFNDEELSINNDEIKKMYSNVYPAHFFLSVDNDGNLVALSESLFSDKPVNVRSLSDNYRYSLVYSQFRGKEEVSANDFSLANMYLLSDLGTPLSFFCYDSVNIGNVQLIGGIYRFLGGIYPVDGITGGGGYVLVDVKKTEDNSLELYEAEYTNNDYEIESEDDILKIYGKDNQEVFSFTLKETIANANLINDMVIKNADKFKQHKIIFTYVPNVGYFLEGTEPVA